MKYSLEPLLSCLYSAVVEVNFLVGLDKYGSQSEKRLQNAKRRRWDGQHQLERQHNEFFDTQHTFPLDPSYRPENIQIKIHRVKLDRSYVTTIPTEILENVVGQGHHFGENDAAHYSQMLADHALGVGEAHGIWEIPANRVDHESLAETHRIEMIGRLHLLHLVQRAVNATCLWKCELNALICQWPIYGTTGQLFTKCSLPG